ncbi:MAG: phospholipase D-like domain-containing protein [Candidatus Gracilibacteria bacterium]
MIYPNSSYKLLSNSYKFLDDLEKEIKKAKSSIDLQFLTFEADAVGNRVAEALFKAKLRGIKIRFIIDHFIDLFHNDYFIHRPRLNRVLQRIITGEWKNTKKLLKQMTEAGIEVRRTNPLGFLKLRRALHRNHKKLVIIDSNSPKQAISYIGGCNLSEHNASWNDFMVKMKGDVISILQNDFNATWEDKNVNGRIEYSDGVVLIDSPKGEHEIMPYVIDLINNAKKRVIIESPYLRGKHILESLLKACRHGVGVRIIVPLHNNHKRLGAPTGRSLKKLIENGIRVYRFKENKGMTHAKALLVDDIAMFGSSNLSESLAKRLCEVNIATHNKSMVKQMQKKLNEDMKMSTLQLF